MAINDKKQIKALYEMLRNKEYDKILYQIKELENTCINEREKKRIANLYRYLKNYRVELERYKSKIVYKGKKELRNMGVQENQNYILVTRRMKHRRMAWTKKGATNLALVVCDEINNKTWEKAERNNKESKLKEKILVNAMLKSVEKVRNSLILQGQYTLNDRILVDMVKRLRNVRLA